MIGYQNTSSSNLLVTAFMRWPLLTTVVTGSLWSVQYLPESATEAMVGACNQVCSAACDRLADEKKKLRKI